MEMLFYDLILFYYETSWGTDVIVLRSFIWNLMRHRCYGAEVIYLYHMKHRCYGAEVIYFVFSSKMENRTLFQMCGRLYLPTFLFRVGLLTLIYFASFMAVPILCPSLPIIFKFSTAVVWPVVFWCSKIGEDTFKCSLYHSSNVLADSPIYSSPHSVLPHLNHYMMLLCFVIVSLSFGNIRRFFKVFLPLKCTCTPYLLQMVL